MRAALKAARGFRKHALPPEKATAVSAKGILKLEKPMSILRRPLGMVLRHRSREARMKAEEPDAPPARSAATGIGKEKQMHKEDEGSHIANLHGLQAKKNWGYRCWCRGEVGSPCAQLHPPESHTDPHPRDSNAHRAFLYKRPNWRVGGSCNHAAPPWHPTTLSFFPHPLRRRRRRRPAVLRLR